MYPRVHEDCWATVTVVSSRSQSFETISGHYTGYLAQVICTMGSIKGVWDLYRRAVASLPSGFALGKTYNHPRYKSHTPTCTQAGSIYWRVGGGGEIPPQN